MVDKKVLANFKSNDRQQTISNPVEAVVSAADSAWVSVSDALPPQIELMFYVSELDQIEIGTYNECTKKWMIPYRDTYFCTGNNWVTHWQFLPKTPKAH